jgi:4-amino-4-deoxy-L-arabinose transferase-like glycosyltransferase
MLLNPWLGLFGMDVAGLRGFSVFFSVLTLIPLYRLGVSLGGERMARWATLIAALSPYQVYLAQEGRMYTLALFLTCSSTLALWRWLSSDRPMRWSILYGVLALAGFFSHYNFVFILVFHGVLFLISLLRHREQRHLMALFPAVLVGVALWLWLPVFQAQQTNLSDAWHFAKGGRPFWTTLAMLVWQPLMVLAGHYTAAEIVMITSAVMLTGYFIVKTRGKGFVWNTYGLLALWIAVPIVTQGIVDLLQNTHTVIVLRYVTLIAPASYLLLGGVLAAATAQPEPAGKPLRAVAVCVLAVAVSIPLVFPVAALGRDKSPARKIKTVLEANLQTGDLIVVNGPIGAPNLVAYYLREANPEQPMLHWAGAYRADRDLAPPEAAIFASYRRVWVFQYHTNRQRGREAIEEFLASLYPVTSSFVDERFGDGNAKLLLYERSP